MAATNGNGNSKSAPATSPVLTPGDELLNCVDSGKRPDCTGTFVFTKGEREFFEAKNFSPPRRCKACRAAKKAEKEADGYNTSGGYNSDRAAPAADFNDRGGGGGGGGKKSRRGGRDSYDD